MAGSQGNGARYTVEFAGAARAQLRTIARHAIYQGRGREVARALRQVLARLASTPLAAGDPLYELRSMRMRVFSAALAPLYIEYGVHMDQPVVIIRHVAGLSDPIE